ncbi:MAG: hypothetical protein FJ368_03615 [Pelagibacterales bacterium]|nr:hypothetical protein [Pelagibacterales bacterium]
MKRKFDPALQEKTLAIINEPFEEMVVGKNATLAYIVSALELGHKVLIHNMPKEVQDFPSSPKDRLEVIELDPRQKQAQDLVSRYKEKNSELKDLISEAVVNKDPNILQTFENEKVKDTLRIRSQTDSKLFVTQEEIQHITNVIQRIEPMKSPFPPEGRGDLRKTLDQIRRAFPHLSFNCPIYCDETGLPQLLVDKDTPQRMNEILQSSGQQVIATPTQEFTIGSSIKEKFDSMSNEYLSLFPDKTNPKIVIKPKDSAQSLGVFSLEFSSDTTAHNLQSLQNSTHESLKEQQLYKIKDNLPESELQQITETILYLESLKTNPREYQNRSNFRISEIDKTSQIATARNLYDHEILAQPFLEGVKSGDIRANIAKNGDGNFELLGLTFRRSNRVSDSKFTTCLTTGGSSPFPTSLLTEEEQTDLHQKINLMLDLLNHPELPLKNKYSNTSEIGVDFLLKGDGKNVFLGEINHHCPALTPISEIMNFLSSGIEANYDGGLKLIKSAITAQISQRQSPSLSCTQCDSKRLKTETEKSLVLNS